MLRSWFKGHDTTVVMLWLEAVFAFINEQNTTAYTRDITQAIRGGNEFLRCLYKGGLWLLKDEAETAIRHSTTFCWSYLSAAGHAFRQQVLRFKISPKFHAFCHFAFQMGREIQNPWILSPMSSCCQQDEDFVGKVAGLSVCGQFKIVHKHTLQRYLINLEQNW